MVQIELPFENRAHAGRLLADRLRGDKGRPDLLVLGLPRGGVPVAFEVARALDAPLDVFVVRKPGIPRHREGAMGAVGSGGIRVLDQTAVRALGIPPEQVEAVTRAEEEE